MLKESDPYKNDIKYNNNVIWNKVLDSLHKQLDSESYNSWISNLNFICFQNDTIVVSAPSKFIREWVINNYLHMILSLIKNINRNVKKIDIRVVEKQEKNKIKLSHIGHSKSVSAEFITTEENEYLEKSSNVLFSNLNINFIFENFISGESNYLAYTIFQDIANDNLDNYPQCKIFYLYSDVGMGKTHLLQSIANKITQNNKNNLKVGYISAERFMHHFVTAVRNNDLLEFKEEIRSVDVFLLDDLQFISGKVSTQKEFSATIDALIELGKIIVVSCDRHPAELETDPRTKSRLIASNVVHIKNAEYDLRVKILKHKNDVKNQLLSTEIINLIAHKVKSNIRELEAALNNIITYCSITDTEPNDQNIEKYLTEHLHFENKEPDIEQIIQVVAKHYGVAKCDILSKSRSKQLVLARQVIANLSRQLTDLSLKEIGQKLGNRDHATVNYYVRNFRKKFNSDVGFVKNINKLKNFLYL